MKLTKEQKIDFMKKAAFIADNSTCLYKIACVGVISSKNVKFSPSAKKDPNFRQKDGFIYLKAWNETLYGEIYCQECDKKGNKICIRREEELKGRDLQKVCSIHAEANLIAKCAKYHIPTENMVLFVTNSPCYICAKSIVQAGIKEVYYMSEHTDKLAFEILEKNAIKIEKLTHKDVFPD